jgi:virginiamycin B lyase
MVTGLAVASSGYLYWGNLGDGKNGGGTIGRARLNGTDVNETFITGASLPTGVTVAGAYLYWANNGTGKIGRARSRHSPSGCPGAI